MNREHFEELLGYYQQEMTYLLRAGAGFSEKYPRIASNLGLSYAGASDPHVQRLLESFAFLTARLQKEIDEKFIRFTKILLGTIYPQFVTPFPSSAIVQFRLSPHLGKTTAGHIIPKETQLYTEALEGQKCRFQTCYPLDLWPIEVSQADIFATDQLDFPLLSRESPWVLRLRIQRFDGELRELNPESLRFHIFGDRILTNFLMEAIFAAREEGPAPLYIKADGQNVLQQLPENSLKSVGFEANEALIPYPQQSLLAYRLLHEFFVFPEKFKFFDITNLDMREAKSYLDIYIPLASQIQPERFRVGKHNFLLGCTPVVNLFPKISEPIDLNHQSLLYRLVPDQRNEETTEIHSISKVVGIRPGTTQTDIYAPFFSFDHKMENNNQSHFWYSENRPSEHGNKLGTDTYISFVDFNFSPSTPPDQTAYAHTLCTNRNLALYVPAGGMLHADGVIPPTTITCLERPSSALYPLSEGGMQWQLISQLSLNHLSISGSHKALESIKELLNLYASINRHIPHPEISALEGINSRHVTRRIGNEAWKGFVQGLGISLSSNVSPFSGDNTFLLSMILNEFFRLYATINSFTELSLHSTQMTGTWRRWPAQIGNQQIL